MSEDQRIIALLSAGVFNSIGSAVKLILGGYYQSSGLQIRYILEAGWLIDYLKTDPKLISEWRDSSEAERQKKFKPGLIRDRLDKRDGFTEKRRAEHYKRLCVLCGHPTFASFTMLRPEMNGDAHIGPFFVKSMLEMTVQELVKCSLVAWHGVMRFFPPQTLSNYKTRVSYLEKHNEWMEYVFGVTPDPALLNECKKIIAERDRWS